MGSQADFPPRGVGFAGLGAMGFSMASNLLAAGISVTGFDLNPDILSKLTALGGKAASTIRDASLGQDKFFIMVATPEQVDSVVFGPQKLTETLPQGAIVCLFSTLPPNYVLELPARLALQGRSDIQLVDCPVSGGAIGAKNGSLTIMLGADEATIEGIKPELHAMSAPNRLFNCGPLGSASVIKMLNQHLAGIHVVAAAEILSFAKVLGLSTRDTHAILMSSAGASWILGDRGVSMLDANWTPRSAVTIFTKDMGIVNRSADEISLPAPLAAVVLEAFMERATRGFGEEDDASVVCNYESLTGLSVQEELPALAFKSEIPPPTSPPIVLIADDAATYKVLSNSIDSEASTRLAVASSEALSLDKVVSSLTESVVFGLTGDMAQPSCLASLQAKYPQHRFFDFHFIASQDARGYQLLYSLDTALDGPEQFLPSLLSCSVAAVPVKGAFGTAGLLHLVIRMATLIHLAAAAECCSFAAAKGVSRDLVYELIAGAAGSSAQFNVYFPTMVKGVFAAKSATGLDSIGAAMRDLSLLKRVAMSRQFPARLLNTAHQIVKAVARKNRDKERSIASVVSFWD